MVCPAMVVVPPLPIEVGIERWNTPFQYTRTCLVLSSAIAMCEAPIRKLVLTSDWPHRPGLTWWP